MTEAMRTSDSIRYPSWAAALVLAMTSGCASICQELGIPYVVPVGSGFASTWQGPPPTAVPPGADARPPAGALPDQISLMAQRIASAEDDRKVLTSRLQMLENQLLEKEKALVHGNFEIQEATQQVHNARKEIQRYKQETDTLRAKLQAMEKENRETLDAVIRSMEQVVDSERESSKGPSLPAIPKVN